MAIILLILQLLPSILALVTQIENAFKGVSVSGAVKKAIVIDALAGTDSKTVAVAGKLIDSTVGTLNKAGVFTHAAADLTGQTPAKAA